MRRLKNLLFLKFLYFLKCFSKLFKNFPDRRAVNSAATTPPWPPPLPRQAPQQVGDGGSPPHPLALPPHAARALVYRSAGAVGGDGGVGTALEVRMGGTGRCAELELTAKGGAHDAVLSAAVRVLP